jgi:hypothetical protein
MNYAELKTNIEDICENSFTDAQLAMFVQQAEQKIYNAVQIPALRKNVTGNLTSGTKYLSTPQTSCTATALPPLMGPETTRTSLTRM